MKELLVCKSCGFIMDKTKLRDKCPACGVSSKMFLPHTENISPFRKLILSLDIHPVLVHFPQAFTVTILILSLLGLIIKTSFHNKIVATVGILSYALPFVVIAAFIAGLVDGKIRFHKVTTPILKQKMMLGILFLVVSCVQFYLALLNPSPAPSILMAIAGLSSLAVVCSTLLGLLGVSIINAKFPG